MMISEQYLNQAQAADYADDDLLARLGIVKPDLSKEEQVIDKLKEVAHKPIQKLSREQKLEMAEQTAEIVTNIMRMGEYRIESWARLRYHLVKCFRGYSDDSLQKFFKGIAPVLINALQNQAWQSDFEALMKSVRLDGVLASGQTTKV